MASTSESGVQLFARLTPRPSLARLEEVLFPEGPGPGEVVEVTGDSSSGKTLLFTRFIARCTKDLGAGVVLLNTDHHFQVYKLVSLMGGPDTEALGRLTVYNLADSAQLQVTALGLRTLLADRPDIGLVLLDSVNAFYWQDTMAEGIRKMDLYVKNTVNNLVRALGDYKGVLMYTRPSYFQSRNTRSEFTGSGTVSRKVTLGQAPLEGVFCAEVETAHHKFSNMYTIDPSGIRWM